MTVCMISESFHIINSKFSEPWVREQVDMKILPFFLPYPEGKRNQWIFLKKFLQIMAIISLQHSILIWKQINCTEHKSHTLSNTLNSVQCLVSVPSKVYFRRDRWSYIFQTYFKLNSVKYKLQIKWIVKNQLLKGSFFCGGSNYTWFNKIMLLKKTKSQKLPDYILVLFTE